MPRGGKREGAGRPRKEPLCSELEKVKICISVARNEVAEMKKKALENGMTLSEYVSKIVRGDRNEN